MDNTVFQMQQAARRRVMEAHEHARRIVQQDACRPARDTGAPTAKPCAPSGGTHDDTEQFLLLILAFFLYKNGASPQVLLALLYLAL